MASSSTVDNSKRKGKSPEKPCRKNPRLCFEEQDNESSTCVICLEIIKDKSFANKCLHKFCFECLLKWSEERAECPLCNGPFTAIIHNVKSDQNYDEHIIVSITSEDEGIYLNSIFNFDSEQIIESITSEDEGSYLNSILNLNSEHRIESGHGRSGTISEDEDSFLNFIFNLDYITSDSSTSDSSTSDSSASDSSTSDSNA